MSILNEHNKIIMDDRDPSEIIPYKNQLIDNLNILNDGVYGEINLLPLKEKFIKYFDESNEPFNKFIIEIDNFSASKTNEKITDNLQITGKDLIQNYDEIVGIIATDITIEHKFLNDLELASAVSISIVLLVLLIVMINTLGVWKNETKSMLQELSKKSEILENINSALNKTALVAITDKNGIITYANQKFCDVSKYSRKELIGKNHRILKSGFHTDEFYTHMWKTIASGKTWHGTIKNKTKNGEYYWVDTTITPFINNSGKIYEYVSIRKDITEFINLQDKSLKSEKLSAIGALAASLAHDLRNPLNIIGNSVEIIMETTKEAFTIENCKRMQNSIERMTHQIEDIMDFVRTRPLKLSRIPIDEIIKNAISSINIPKEITLKMPQNNIEIFCDISQMVIVFNNIIYNAVQKLDKGGIIQIIAKQSSHELIIQIQDSGDPISEEDLTKIFEPLYTTKQRGTGLGLASCKKIIESHHGVLYASNNPTTFTIKIPRN
jgi:PAS domain S-box-containing protein